MIHGDSIRDGKAEQIRLNGIDCPEKKQPFGTRAKQFTSQEAFGKEVTVKEVGRDRYGRTLAEVILPDGRSLNQELLKAGLAWWFRKYSKDIGLGDLEDEARLANRGLWADKNPVPPWEWRRTPLFR
ncbi:MAG: thermonuclease family protein [Nitrospiraceae bacterium]